MATREPWECPRCHRILAPHMDFCDCSGGTAGVTAVPFMPVPSPSIPASPLIPPAPSVTTISPTTTWPGTVTVSYPETTWSGVTILNAGRAA